MDKKLECLYCGNPMELVIGDKIQLGEREIPFSLIAFSRIFTGKKLLR